MKIYLIRHGQTTGDLEDRYGGDYDDHLTEEGRSQAGELAEKLKDRNIKHLLHSPRLRAIETAQIVFDQMGIPMKEIEDLKERNGYGVLTGLIRAEAKERFPEEVAKNRS